MTEGIGPMLDYSSSMNPYGYTASCGCPTCQGRLNASNLAYVQETPATPAPSDSYYRTMEQLFWGTSGATRSRNSEPPPRYPLTREHYAGCVACQRSWPPATQPAFRFGESAQAYWSETVPETVAAPAPEPVGHGSARGVRRHENRSEALCEKCRAFKNECGTLTGFRRHLDVGEKACAACLKAEIDDLDDFYSAGSAERNWRVRNQPGNAVT